ncbi:MAG: DMT family transporter [Saprospiraceae bacterium]|nr:DMT family transporter [Saprospiraceae bacterium]
MLSERQLGVFWVLLGNVLFSTKAIFAKLIFVHGVDPTMVITLRMTFAFPFFVLSALFFHRRRKDVLVKKFDWAHLLLFAFLGYYGASFLNFSGLQYITASLERVILFTYPAMVLTLLALFYKEKITKIQVIALFLTYGGIVISLVPNIGTFEKGFLLGALLVLGSAFIFSVYMVRVGDFIQRYGSLLFTSYIMILATFLVWGHFLIFGSFENLYQPTNIYLLFLGMSILSTFLPVFMISEGIRSIGASNVSLVAAIGPIATIFLAYTFLDERLNTWQIVGTLFVLTGIFLVGRKAGKAPVRVR